MKNKYIAFQVCLWCLAIIIVVSCRTSTQEGTGGRIDLLGKDRLVFMDSIGASRAIVRDEVSGFFEKIGITDMLIQMKRPFVDSLDREKLLVEYKAYLKTEVTDFTKQERDFCQGILSEIAVELAAIHPDLFPDSLRLIKSHGNHYGSRAYYTRENVIVIPKGMLFEANEEGFYETMLHELFHIYSRYHPVKREALYGLIGFRSVGQPEDLQMDKVLRDRVLLNPDGVNCAYAITVQEEGTSVFAIPLIVARARGYEEDKAAFFDYLQFDLYPIRAPYSRLVRVVCRNDGSSRLKIEEIGDFYGQIQRNTDYIIHPDEILADNFVFMVKSVKDSRFLGRFDEGGVELIERVLREVVRE